VPASRPVRLLPVLALLVITLRAPHVAGAGAGAAGPPVVAALLGLADLPPGWTGGREADPGDGAVMDSCDGGPPVTPLGMATAQFQGGEDGPFVRHYVAAFAPGDAARAFGYIRRDFSACGGTRDEGFTITPLSLPPLADEQIAVRLTVPDPDVEIRTEVVILRRGDALTLVQVVASGPADTESALTEQLARLASERLPLLAPGKRVP